jgi:cytochrome c1
MTKIALTLMLLLTAFGSLASGGKSCGQIDCYDAKVDLRDQASLQRGAATFVNYCMGCHEAGYSRYERVATDLGIPLELAEEHLIFDDSKIGDLMVNAMPEKAAKKWFGAAPPDLTLVARARGSDWLYTYLLTFYEDAGRPWGTNNLVFKDVGMPNAMLELQGAQKCLPGDDAEHRLCGVIEHVPDTGTQAPEEFEQTVHDLTNFMTYMAEPIALERQRLGVYVMFFLAFFLVVAWLLNREYWKDVH